MGTVTPYSAFMKASKERQSQDRALSLDCLNQVYADLELSSLYKKYNFKEILEQLVMEGQAMSTVDVDRSLRYGTRREITFVFGGIYSDELMMRAIDGFKHSLNKESPGKYDKFSKPSQLFNAMLASGEALKRFSHDMRAIPQLQTRYAIAPYGDNSMAAAIVLTVKDQFEGGMDAYINRFLNTYKRDHKKIQSCNRAEVLRL